ncbi:MAG: anti-sigma factor domain-containing protein [Gammaproteobacteria bacterium]|nr:anti-sigma factor domain-containing protein [Gammaproteobacteria bacterium]
MKLSIIITFAALCWSVASRADVYAYVNDNGDYVVTPDKPGRNVAEYAVLTDDGEFIRLVRPRDMDVPITHWRPWFLPKEPDPYDADPELYREREGTVGIEELPEDPQD